MNIKDMDEELLREADWAAENIPDDAVPKPLPDELEKILRRIEKERRV